jgi:hypothetical protein
MEEDNCSLKSPEVQLQLKPETSGSTVTIEAWEVRNYSYNWSLRSPEVQLQLKPEKSGSTVTIELENMEEDKCSLWSLKYNCNWTWQLELPIGYFLLQRRAKDARRWCREEGSEGRRDRKKEVETQAQTVLTLGLDQITKFIYRLDGPLGEGNV